MARKYAIRNQEAFHFVTFTVIEWIDIFTRDESRNIFINSVKHCQKEKGLEVGAWCIMTNHIHMILGTSGKMELQDIIRDLKSFTSRQIRHFLENNTEESRRKWMLKIMKAAGENKSNNRDYQFWQQHNHPIELSTIDIMMQRLAYVHQNPVKDGFVENSTDWIWSSARDYEDRPGLIDIHFLY